MIDPTMGRGAPPSGIKLLQPAAVKYLAVHCSATPTGRDIGAAELDAMHRQRGFLKIGYHYVIRLDGRVEKGRSDAEVGAHVEGHNSESIGICLVGGVDANLKPEAGFTDAQFGSSRGPSCRAIVTSRTCPRPAPASTRSTGIALAKCVPD